MPVKTNCTATYAGMFLCCALLAACSSSQNAFFAQKDALISQGYKWKKLDKCRVVKKGALAIPITVSDGRKLVCYTMLPPQDASSAESLPAVDNSQTAPSNQTLATTTNATTPGTTPATTLAMPADTPADTSGIIWNFSNF